MERRRADSIEGFLELLERSGLSTRNEARRLFEEFRERVSDTHMPDITAFCTFLVATETLTTWQCEKLRNGQWKGFVLDDFVLLDKLGSDADFGYYLGRDADGSFVRLKVTPPDRWTGPNVEYCVDQRFG